MFSRESSGAIETEKSVSKIVAGPDVRNQMNKDFEQIRACDRQEIQQLKTSLDENSQTNRALTTQQEELIKQLQAKIDLAKVTTVDMEAF